MSNFLIRSISGTVYLIIIIGSIFTGKYTFGLLFFTINILALLEFYKIIADKMFFPAKYTGIVIGSVLFVTTFLISSNRCNNQLYLVFIPLSVLITVPELFRNKPYPFINIAITMLGVLYISLPLSLLNYIVFHGIQPGNYSYEILLGYLILIWTNDTSAYISGITLGRHLLFKRVSPKKTWEGFIGGGVVTIIVAWLMSGTFTVIGRIDFLMFAVIVSIIGVAGDLAESLLKRSANLKDAGNILPGHGGILDRIDSLLLTSPLIFCYLMIIN